MLKNEYSVVCYSLFRVLWCSPSFHDHLKVIIVVDAVSSTARIVYKHDLAAVFKSKLLVQMNLDTLVIEACAIKLSAKISKEGVDCNTFSLLRIVISCFIPIVY